MWTDFRDENVEKVRVGELDAAPAEVRMQRQHIDMASTSALAQERYLARVRRQGSLSREIIEVYLHSGTHPHSRGTQATVSAENA